MSKLGKNDFATENENLPRSYSGRFGALLSGLLKEGTHLQRELDDVI